MRGGRYRGSVPLNLSFTHLAVVAVVALVVLGPDKLPDAIRTLARLVADVRRMTDTVREEVRGTFGEFTEPITELVESVRGVATTAVSGAPSPPPVADTEGDTSPLAPGIPALGPSTGLVAPGPPLPALPLLSPEPPAPGTYEVRG